VHKQQRPLWRVAVSCYPLSSVCRSCACIHHPRRFTSGAARLTTRFTRLGFVDREGTAFELFAVEPLNSGLAAWSRHLDKPKTFGRPVPRS